MEKLYFGLSEHSLMPDRTRRMGEVLARAEQALVSGAARERGTL